MDERIAVWEPRFSVEEESLDSDHQKLFSIINDVNSYLIASKDESLNECLIELSHYTNYHFKREEEIMEKMNFPGLEAHRKLHKEFYDKTVEMQKILEVEGTKDQLAELLGFLLNWLENHILTVDREYVHFSVENNINMNKLAKIE